MNPKYTADVDAVFFVFFSVDLFRMLICVKFAHAHEVHLWSFSFSATNISPRGIHLDYVCTYDTSQPFLRSSGGI